MSVWIRHKELDRYSEVEEESVPVWVEAGWEVSSNPNIEEAGRYSESELAARREQLASTGLQVVPPLATSDQVPTASTETPADAVSTEPASLKQDSGTPQED